MSIFFQTKSCCFKKHKKKKKKSCFIWSARSFCERTRLQYLKAAVKVNVILAHVYLWHVWTAAGSKSLAMGKLGVALFYPHGTRRGDGRHPVQNAECALRGVTGMRGKKIESTQRKEKQTLARKLVVVNLRSKHALCECVTDGCFSKNWHLNVPVPTN